MGATRQNAELVGSAKTAIELVLARYPDHVGIQALCDILGSRLQTATAELREALDKL